MSDGIGMGGYLSLGMGRLLAKQRERAFCVEETSRDVSFTTQRVVKKSDKSREAARVWHYWNIKYEEWNRKHHVGIQGANPEVLCI